MTGSVKKVQWSMIAGLAGLLFAAGNARAAATSCTIDTMCANAACGGDVCDWAKNLTCQPAGTDPKGTDGWCMKDDDCKCFAQGARCQLDMANQTTLYHCTFTKPSDAPSGAGGSTGSAGTTGSAGSTGSAGTTGTAGTGTDGGTSTGSSGGGCNVGGNAGAGWLSVALLGLTAAFVRRRRA